MSIEAMKQVLEKIATVNAMDYEYQRWAREALAIAEGTDVDAICQDLQEKTYTQAMRIAELEAKLKEKNT